MNKILIILFSLIGAIFVNAQELNCTATVNSSKVSGSNKQVFKTLEKAINEFMNNTKWTNKTYKTQEKIQCALTINISEQVDNDTFKGSLQLQVVRPVFNSTYLTPVLNYNDKDILFNYEEFQPLILNKSNFESNLVSLLSFYAYISLGVDADSFALNGGDEHFKNAENIMLLAQQSGAKGWNSIDGNATRFKLIDNLLDPTFAIYRELMYTYHLKGLDTMLKNKAKAKKTIAYAISKIKKMYLERSNAYLIRIFIDTKGQEILSVFKDGPRIDTTTLKEVLAKVYPSQNHEWEKIK